MKREEAIKDLDIIRFNPHWDELVNEEYWQELMEMAITALKNQPGWIPVSERLPEKSYGCLVTVMDFEPLTQTDFENILPYFVGYDGHGWNNADGETIPFEVIAWMPQPEPYRESEPHKQTNADRIRSMTDEELAEFIARNNYDCANYCEDAKCGCSWSCGNKDKTIALQWLQKESEETK